MLSRAPGSKNYLDHLDAFVQSSDVEPIFERLIYRIQRLTLPKGRNFNEAPHFISEKGKTTQGVRYFYIQELGQKGWLFELTDQGWILSRAQKVNSQDTFIRDYEIQDIVNLFRPNTPGASPRVQSLNDEFSRPISYNLYEQKLLSLLKSESPSLMKGY